MDELLQPFPTSFAKGGNIFVAASGEIHGRDSNMHRHDFYELVWLWIDKTNKNGRCLPTRKENGRFAYIPKKILKFNLDFAETN